MNNLYFYRSHFGPPFHIYFGTTWIGDNIFSPSPYRWLLQEREGKAARVGYVAVEIFREGGWLGGEPKKKKFYGEKRG